MNRIPMFAATAILGLGTAFSIGAVRASAGSIPAHAASELNSDIQAGQSGPSTTANDQATAAEFNVDDGQVNNVNEQTAQSGDQQTGDQQGGGSSAGQTGEHNGVAGSGAGSQGDAGGGAGANGSNSDGAGTSG